MDNENRATSGETCAPWLSEFPPARRLKLLVALGIAGVYLLGVTGQWWPTPDSALYLGLGKSLALGHGYAFNGQPSNAVTPGLPLILSGLRLYVGSAFYFWANLFITLTGLASLWLVYLSLRQLTSDRVALGLTLASASVYVFYSSSHRILTDAPFALLFWATMYAMLRLRHGGWGWMIVAGLASAMAVAVRAPGLLPLGLLALGLAMDAVGRPVGRRMLAASVAMVAIITMVAIQFYQLGQRGEATDPLYLHMSMRLVDTGWPDILPRVGKGLMQLPRTFAMIFTSQRGIVFLQIGWLAMALAALGSVRLWIAKQRVVSILIILYPFSLVVLTGGNQAVEPRYLAAAIPLLLYATLAGVLWLMELYGRRQGRAVSSKAMLWGMSAVLGAVICFNVPRLAREAVYYRYLSHKPQYLQVVKDKSYAELFSMAERMGTPGQEPSAVMIVRDRSSMVHYLTGRITVPMLNIPAQTAAQADKVVRDIRSQGALEFVVLDRKEAAEPFLDGVVDRLMEYSRWQMWHDGRHYIVLRRVSVQPVTRPATRPAAQSTTHPTTLPARLQTEIE